MSKIKPFVIQPALRSLIPFLAGSCCYALKGLWLDSSKPNLQVFLCFLSIISEICFGIYNNFFAFLLTMLFIDIVFRVVQKETKKSKPSSDLILEFPEKKSPKLFNLFSENQVIRILSYLLIFAVFQIAGLCLSFTQSDVAHSTITLENSQDTQMLSEMIMMKNIDLPPSRILEEVDSKTTPIPVLPNSSDKISLSMGNVMSSLNLVVTAMTLSKDKKTVFATLDFYGTLKIIDISDLQNPVIAGSLGLSVPEYSFSIKTLLLSSDEKTLYISNSKDLEIIDISDISSPKLISSTASEIISENNRYETTRYYRTSLALDEKTMTLFIGGLGLQIYDVSSPKNPVLLKAEKNDLEKSEFIGSDFVLKRNEVCLSHDGKFLLIANGTLDVYNISNPRNLEKVFSLQTKSSPRSILLLENSKEALILGTSKDEVVLEKIEISELGSVSVLESYNLGEKSNYSPRFLAVSPSKTKAFIFLDQDYRGYDLFVFDLTKNTGIRNRKSLIGKTQTMAFSPDGKTLITGSNDQFMVVELFLEYPNKQIWSGTALDVILNITRPSNVLQMMSSPDGNTLYISRSFDNDESTAMIGIFEIVDMRDVNKPKVLGSYKNSKVINYMQFTSDFKTVYLIDQKRMTALDISDSSSPRLKTTFTRKNSDGMIQILLSSNEKTGFITRYNNTAVYVSILDLSEGSEVKEIFTFNKAFTSYNCRMTLLNEETLLILDKELLIYDVSDINP